MASAMVFSEWPEPPQRQAARLPRPKQRFVIASMRHQTFQDPADCKNAVATFVLALCGA